VLGNALPPWHDGALVGGLVEMPQVQQSIDAMGGVARFDSIDLRINDLSGAWARIFRVRQPNEYRAIAPNPIEYDTTDIDLEDATGIVNGDVLYAEQDTWTVTDISAAPTITVTRQTYSCLEDGWRCRYQAGVARDYVTTASTSGPVTVMGRLVAIYIDDQLEMLGRVVDLRQHGRSWQVRIDDALAVLTRAIKPTGLGVRLRYPWNWNFARWKAGTFECVADAGTGDHGGTVEDLAVQWDPGWNTIDPAPEDAWVFEPSYGMRWYGDQEPAEINRDGTYYGTAKALGEEWFSKPFVGFVTRTNGVRPYGVIFTPNDIDEDYLEVSTTYYDGAAYRIEQYIGAFVQIGDQLCKIGSVTTGTGKIIINQIIDRNTGELYHHLSAGADSETWVELPVVPVIAAGSLYEALQDVLGGTGSYGLGLPPGLISDAPCQPVGGVSPVWWDWEKAGIDDDLRARGVCLCLRGGQFEVRQVSPPIPQASVAEIAQADFTLDGDVPEIARGYEAPVAAISYETADERMLTLSWGADTPITASALRDLKLTSATRDIVPDLVSWYRLQAARLRWLSVGIPTMRFGLLTDSLSIGDVIKITTRYIANGDYYPEELSAIVIGRTPGLAEYLVAVNLGPLDEGAIWALGVEVASAAGAVITPTSQADLAAFAALVPVGTDVTITEMDSTSLIWTGTIASYQATTVTLSGAPTIDADEIAILTCETIPGSIYTDLVARQVYAAAASGLIDWTYPAKELT